MSKQQLACQGATSCVVAESTDNAPNPTCSQAPTSNLLALFNCRALGIDYLRRAMRFVLMTEEARFETAKATLSPFLMLSGLWAQKITQSTQHGGHTADLH